MNPGNDEGGTAESIVLEEDYDPNYEPTQTEIEEYAVFLGSTVAIASFINPTLWQEWTWSKTESCSGLHAKD